MRLALTVFALLLVALPAAAGPYAPHEYDFSEVRGLEASAFGIVESVRGLSDAQEVVVRLEDGRELVVVQRSGPVIQPGERVRLVGAGRHLLPSLSKEALP